MRANELIQFGAVELARLIRHGQVDPIEVVDAHISQIQTVNPRINALITATFDEARLEAVRVRRIAKSKVSDLPLLGVPITVKDALAVAGVRFTAGSTFYRDNIAGMDAESVRRLRAAGAIVLGKTNCPDMSASTETTNLVFGLTRNPWNPDRSAGGSSGGEASLIASGGSPLGIGSDFGGSIRIPAAFCGVFGLKPTGGRIPTQGHLPETPHVISDWNTVGPIARSVEDIALALSVLSNTQTSDYRAVELSQRRFLLPKFLWYQPVSDDVAAAVETAAAALRSAGMVGARASLPLMKVDLDYIGVLSREWLHLFGAALGGGQPLQFHQELLSRWSGKPRVSSAGLIALATLSLFCPMVQMLGYGRFDRMQRMRCVIQESMGPGGVMLWPVFPTTAPKHGFAWNLSKSPSYTTVFNGLGFPALAMPVGLSKDGQPLSVQIIGQPNEDETVLAVAAALERAFGGWRRPPIS